MTLPRAVYLHVPFCLHHCGYCDFTLVAGRDTLIPDYLQALDHELNARAVPSEVDTIFIGGGTPTYLSPRDLSSLLERFLSVYRLAPGGEFSVEANPDGLCQERLGVLKDFGVNRLSLGVQSFDDGCLKVLERSHSADEAVRVVERCRGIFENLSVDLIFGVPGQDSATWQRSLDIAAQLPLSHVSTYGLTFEPATPFFRREQKGQLSRTPDDAERTMYLMAIGTLNDAGFEHYEVSNFARPGFACRHNRTYWKADEYEAFGPGAARYVGGVRSTNCRSVVRWIRSWLEHAECLHETESLSSEDRAREAIMLGLRMIPGIDLREFQRRYGISINSLAEDAIARHSRNGLLEYNDQTLKLTQDGLLLADTVISDFL